MARSLAIAALLALALTVAVSGEPLPAIDLAVTLRRISERVEQHFARAQSIICFERVHLQSLGHSLGPEGFPRRVDSELRLSWEPPLDETVVPEARMLRQVMTINGRPPRKNDPNSCTSPEKNSTDTHPLSMLLASQQRHFTFAVHGRGRVDRRPAIVLDYKEIAKPSVEVHQVEGTEHCVSFQIDGGMHGRIWADEESFDILRLDQRLATQIDIPLPAKVRRGVAGERTWTLERLDISTRFKPVAFEEPAETLTLPVSVSSLRVTRGSGTPRLRTMTEYSGYKRFLTGGRVVPR